MTKFILISYATLFVIGCGSSSDSDGNWYDNLLDVTGWQVIDHMGKPGASAIFLHNNSSKTDEFNQIDLPSSTTEYQPIVKAKATEFRSAVAAVFEPEDSGSSAISVDALAELMIPDLLTYDSTQDTKFPNGRALEDDVMDAMLGLALNRGNVLGGGSGLSDGVANDSDFVEEFPYFAEENSEE